jgi:parallel beta-helix repeat protein
LGEGDFSSISFHFQPIRRDMKFRRRINSGFISILFLLLCVAVAYENCSGGGPSVGFSSDPSNVLRSQGGRGDGFEGKPAEGDWVRTFPDYSCPDSLKSMQAKIRMDRTTGQILTDNCEEKNISISKVDPGIDFAFYNPDYFTFAGSIFQIYDGKTQIQVNESLCRFRSSEIGIDAVITSDASKVISAKVLKGDYSSRQINSLNYSNINKDQSASSVTFSSSDGNLNLVINGTPQAYKNLSGTLSTTIDSGKKQFQVVCQKMSERPVLSPSPINISTFYIDRNTGSDANTGLSETTAFFSVPRCASIVKPGDSCVVKNGTYTENILVTTSGTATARITFRNYLNHRPILSFTDTTVYARFGMAHADVYNQPSAYITVEGFEIANGRYDGANFVAGTELIFRNNHFRNNIGFGLSGRGYRVTLERNLFVGNGTTTAYEAIQLGGQENKIINNIFQGTGGAGLNLVARPFDGVAFSDPLFFEFTNNLIANNTFVNNGGAGVLLWQTNGGAVSNNRIYNNIFYNNCQTCASAVHAVELYFVDRTGNEINNNLFFSAASGPVPIKETGPISPNCYTESNNLNAIPLFVNVSAENFRLQSSSPAIDRGFNLLPSVLTDFDGTPRPRGAGFDIGAFEF